MNHSMPGLPVHHELPEFTQTHAHGGEGNGTPLQYSCLEKSHGWRSLVGCSPWECKELDTTEWFHFHALEKEMAMDSSVLAWRIPGMGEPGGLLLMGSHRVRHNWNDLAATAAYPLSQWCHPNISFSVVPYNPTLNLSQHRGLFKWVSSLIQVAKVLEFQLHHQSFQWTPRTDLR